MEQAGMTTLEARYRRLLSWYPLEHRQRYGDEMLAVLMSSASPEQRHPRFGEAVNLLLHGIVRRLIGGQVQPARGPWSTAAAVTGFAGALLMAADHARYAIYQFVQAEAIGTSHLGFVGHPSSGATWMMVVLLVLAGWRWPAVATAWLAAIAEVALGLPQNVLTIVDWAPMVLGFATAVLLSVRWQPKAVRQTLGMRRLGALGLAALLIAAAYAATFGFVTVTVVEPGHTVSTSQMWVGYMPGVLICAAVAVFLLVVRRLGGELRLRVLALSSPGMLLYLYTSVLFWTPWLNLPSVLVVIAVGVVAATRRRQAGVRRAA